MTDRDYASSDAERRFRRQMRSMLTVLAVLFAINAVTSWGNWWVQWPALGMGIGLAFQYKRMLDARDDATGIPVGATTSAVAADDDLTRRAEELAAREKAAG